MYNHKYKIKRKLPSLKTILALTNDVGIVQHTRYKTPDLRHGYCLDDNGRALAFTTRYLNLTNKNREAVLKLSNTYLSYINVCQKPDGWMHNFISFDNHFLENTGSEDSFGRAIWGLGECAAMKNNESQKLLAAEILLNSLDNITKLQAPRAIAYSLLGLNAYYSVHKHEQVAKCIKFGHDALLQKYKQNKSDNWIWFENVLAYSNALLPLALFMSAKNLAILSSEKIAIASFEWLLKQTEVVKDNATIPSPIGNHGWYRKNGVKAILDQQPIDVTLTILTASYFYKATKEKKYRDIAKLWFTWFLGNNVENVKVASVEDGYSYDGLQEKSTSQNHGAESVIAFLLAQLEIFNLK
jgi:hypothetical protein